MYVFLGLLTKLLLLNIHSFHSNNVYTENSVLGLTMHWLFCNRYRNLALLIEKTSWTDVRLPNSMYLCSLILKEYAGTAENFKETILWLFIYGVKMLVRVDHVIKFYNAQRALWPKNSSQIKVCLGQCKNVFLLLRVIEAASIDLLPYNQRRC